MNLFDLTGKTAVVIGGTGVLGSAIAHGLANQGASVAIVGRNHERGINVVHSILQSGGHAMMLQVDATKKGGLEQCLSGVIDWTGQVDILVNTLGTNSATSFFELEMDEWDSIMDVNLKSLVLSCQVFGKQMIDQSTGGSIINISSVSSDPPLSRVFTYSASKAGVNNVTQFLAREWAPYNIRVNAVIPGFFPAEQNRKILTAERVESILRHTPSGRFGEPHELQGVTVWLACDKASSFVTGALIRVDGGFGAMTI